MQKSRLLSGAAFVLALLCTVPAGLVLAKQSNLFHASTNVEASDNVASIASQNVEFAMTLSDDKIDTTGSRLNFATITDVVSLPKNSANYEDSGSKSIDFYSPEVQKQLSDLNSRESLEHIYLNAEANNDYNDGFVFDIEKTIFPVTPEEVEMLKYVVEAEAGGDSIEAKRIVAFSITNRVLAKSFPNTLYKVLHSANQFSTIQNYYNKKKTPSESTCRAVEEVLMGACEDNSQNCMYFYCTDYPIADWIIDWFENDLVYLYTVGCDRFFTDPA